MGGVDDGDCCPTSGPNGGLVFGLAGCLSSSTPCANVHPRKLHVPVCSQFLQIVVLYLDGSVPMRFDAGSGIAISVVPDDGVLPLCASPSEKGGGFEWLVLAELTPPPRCDRLGDTCDECC